MNVGIFIALGGALILSMVLVPGPARAASAPAKLPASFDLDAIDAFLGQEVQTKGRVGFSVAIVKDGKIVLARGYGRRSLVEPLPVSNDTGFAIGSVTKQFTCAAVLLLAEAGKLSIHDPVGRYFPGLTRAAHITLLDLMNQVSGYPDYYPLDFVDRRMMQPVKTDEVIGKYATGKLDFEPGTKYSYSNTGYLILGRVVEKVSGDSMGAFLQSHLFTPLGMNHTLYDPERSDDRLARGYTVFALCPPEPAIPEGKGWIASAGAIYSTPSDLALWDLALMGGKVLKPESYRLMTMARQLPDGTSTEYGCGLRACIMEKRLVLSHGGMVAGFQAWNGMIPSTMSAVIMAANTGAGLGELPEQILGLLLKEQPDIPKINGPETAAAVKKLFGELQQNKIDRSRLAEAFNWFLTPKRVTAAARRLKPFGAPTKVEVLKAAERGRMEVSVTRLTFKSGRLRALMYRRTDGIIEQFFVEED
ncbi:MAG: serine hydrolase domain-containing protein [Limisphaerales bacterium]